MPRSGLRRRLTAPSPIEGSFAELPMDEPWPGVRRRAFDSQGATVTQYEFEPGAEFPLHSHPQEQITLIAKGEVHLTVAGEETQLAPGDWSVIPQKVEHGIKAGAVGARFVAIIVPRRESPNAYTVATGEGR
jgi:quercetin dioxygenase-like cupin family protein